MDAISTFKEHLTSHSNEHPAITLTYAQSLDGFISAHADGGAPTRISCDASMQMTHSCMLWTLTEEKKRFLRVPKIVPTSCI